MAENKGGKVDLLTKNDLAKLSVIYNTTSIIPWKTYDVVRVPTSSPPTEYNFFAHTKGGSGLGITNLEQANMLISGKSQVIKRIELDLQPVGAYVAGSLADLIAVGEALAALTFTINNVEYAQSKVKDFLGGGFFGFGTPATNIAYVAPRNIVGFDLDPAVVIPTNTSFGVQIKYNTAPTVAVAVDATVKLCGPLMRLASA